MLLDRPLFDQSAGALAEAQAEREVSKQTTLDHKIEQRLLSAGAKLKAREVQKVGV